MNDQRYITTEVKTIIAETLRVRMPVFRQLRNQQTNLVVILSEKYQELDKIQAKPEEETNVSQLYSDDGKQQYLKLLEKKIAIVRQLADISSNRRWPQLLSYYQTLSHNLNNSNFTETICEENAIESKEKYATKSEKKGKEKITKSVKEKQPTQSANQLLKKQELSPFQKLKQTYEHLQKNTKNIVLLVELIEKLQVIDPKELGFEQLEIFQVIQKQTLDSGVKCFERALLMGNFIEARQLIQFFDESQYKWKGHALATKNTMLVKFLVNELDFPLENYSITVGKKDYFNVYEYCYENAKQNHEMAELFEFFLSIDFLSICRSINGSLPIAHRILTEKPNSPLLNILEKNPSKTIDNRFFYQQLIKSCQSCIDEMLEGSEERNLLEKEVNTYRAKQKIVASESGLYNVETLIEKNKFISIAKEKLSEEIVTQIYTDEKILRRSQELTQKTVQLRKNFQKSYLSKRGKCAPINKLFQEEFVLSQQLIQEMQCENIDFIELRQEVLSYYDKVDKLLSDGEELLKIQTKLLNMQVVYGKKNKAHTNLIKEEAKLISLIMDQADELLPSKQVRNDEKLTVTIQGLVFDLKELTCSMDDVLKKINENKESSCQSELVESASELFSTTNDSLKDSLTKLSGLSFFPNNSTRQNSLGSANNSNRPYTKQEDVMSEVEDDIPLIP